MIRIIFVFGIFIFLPVLVLGSTASDFVVNNQPTYPVPPNTTELLILDLTLPGNNLTSIKIFNAGTAAQSDISRLVIYQDGPSSGWDGDESEMVRKISSPFFDTVLNGDFFKDRIFVTIDISSTTYTGKTIKPEIQINSAEFSDTALNGPTDVKVVGFERTILAGSDTPSAPLSPLARSGEALSTSTIRWHFTDLSNNEFGFKILDENLNTVVVGGADISYIDETGLEPDTEYSGRQVKAFNDRGHSLVSTLTVFSPVQTLPLPAETEVIEESSSAETAASEEVTVQESAEKVAGELIKESPAKDGLRAQILELQQKIIELLNQLIQLLQEQISAVKASLFSAFEIFVSWF